MTNEDITLWMEALAIIVAFSGAFIGAWATYHFELKRRKSEGNEQINEFKNETLRKLNWYAILLETRPTETNKDKLEELLLSLKYGAVSNIYYKIPKDDRYQIDSVLELLIQERYSEAKTELNTIAHHR